MESIKREKKEDMKTKMKKEMKDRLKKWVDQMDDPEGPAKKKKMI